MDKLLNASPPPNPLGLKNGDIVELKSGGPAMTVTSINLTGLIICQWFEGEKLHRARFLPSSVAVSKN